MDHTRDSLTLSWGASQSDGGSPILHYILERREGWKTWGNPVKVKPEGEKLTCCVQNLKEGQDYYFRVFAENTVGASPAIETETAYKPRSPFSEFVELCHVLVLYDALYVVATDVMLEEDTDSLSLAVRVVRCTM